MFGLPFVQAAQQAGVDVQAELSQLQYVLNWNTMTLQDAVDFLNGMIQITIAIQRFTAGIVSQLGDVAGVGGPVDIGVIRPGWSVEWVQRKRLHSGGHGA